VRIRTLGGSEVETSAFANSGVFRRGRLPDGRVYSRALINIPPSLVRKLGLALSEQSQVSFEGADSRPIAASELGRVEVKLVVPDRETP